MKHVVHLFVIVRLNQEGIEAESHEQAVHVAQGLFDDLYCTFQRNNVRYLPEGVTDIEFGEEFSHFLVDEENDPEHEKSTWHDAYGNVTQFDEEKNGRRSG